MTTLKTTLSIIAVMIMLLIAVVTARSETTPQNFKVISWTFTYSYDPDTRTYTTDLIPVYQHIQH